VVGLFPIPKTVLISEATEPRLRLPLAGPQAHLPKRFPQTRENRRSHKHEGHELNLVDQLDFFVEGFFSILIRSVIPASSHATIALTPRQVIRVLFLI